MSEQSDGGGIGRRHDDIQTPFGLLRPVNDGKGLNSGGEVFRFELRCPGCGLWGLLDDDQLHGRVSVDHAADGCSGGYHETHDFASHIPNFPAEHSQEGERRES